MKTAMPHLQAALPIRKRLRSFLLQQSLRAEHDLGNWAMEKLQSGRSDDGRIEPEEIEANEPAQREHPEHDDE